MIYWKRKQKVALPTMPGVRGWSGFHLKLLVYVLYYSSKKVTYPTVGIGWIRANLLLRRQLSS